MREVIAIRGARTHNLQGVDLDLPVGGLVVFTGVSGSGKSSLALDTIFAEGRRRYIECLAPFARRYIDQLPTPDVDDIRGLPPTLAVAQDQRPRGDSPRSTVATLTEIHDHLRLLYARCGEVACHQCGKSIATQSLDEMLAATESLPEGTRLHILAPLVHGRKGSQREAFLKIRREGFVRARVDGVLSLIDGPLDIDPDKTHDIEMVVDRWIVRPGMRDRLAESFQTALRHGDGTLIVAYDSEDAEWIDRGFSSRFACRDCGIGYPELEPRTFSFNSPYGACPGCHGLGVRLDFDPGRVVPDPSLSLTEGAVAPFRTKSGKPTKSFLSDLKSWAKSPDWLATPFGDLPVECRRELWEGSEGFEGIRRRLERLSEAIGAEEDDPVATYRRSTPCSECQGTRLGPIGRSVRIGGRTIAESCALTIDQARALVANWSFDAAKRPIAEPVVAELSSRLDFLVRVGVGYISLDRTVGSLSGGEAQRIRLASCVGSGLSGVCYVLDEPTIGLHARDTDRLLDVLGELRDRENTVLVVEHDARAMRRADLIVDLGPGAGRNGGRIINVGSYDEFVRGEGLTAEYLRGRRHAPGPAPAEVPTTQQPELIVRGVRHHNLEDVTVSIPLGRFVCVTGVSGSGKSSLVVDVIVPAVRGKLGLGGAGGGDFDEIEGALAIEKVIEVDQSPIGRSPRSTPASFTGAMDPIRQVFAKTREAKVRGYKAGRFSFNHKEGQCPKCQGLGAFEVDLAFLPDMYVPCDSCRGRRYNSATLAIQYRGKSIADVLAMTVDESAAFFENHPKPRAILETLRGVGLGYLQLGQSAPTLSGGEAQRIKLAAELARPTTGPTLYVLDEPTIGLHFHDVAHLVDVLKKLVAAGHSVLVIEHNLDLIRQADWIIDLGPDGGEAGGRIVAQGTPQQVRRQPTETGRALKSMDE